jgi:phosphatidate phosphatase APP1
MRPILSYLGFLLILVGTFCGAGTAGGQEAPSRIKSDERIVFFPTAARLSDDGQSWIIPIHGWIFEPEAHDWWRAPFVRELRGIADLSEGQPLPALFEDRVRLFLVDNERGKRIGIRLADQVHVLSPSTPGGHFTDAVRLPIDLVKQKAATGRIEFQAVTDAVDKREFVGHAFCMPPNGVSVISDIDDTIKKSEVRNKQELVRNTLLREFRAVDGMAAVYHRWAKADAQFHYVSSTPWQLYEPLSMSMKASAFPDGTFHFKTFRAKDSTALDLFANPAEHKLSVIGKLFEEFPGRRFILVGDSGEKDPEIYGRLARRFPKQIEQIYIRNVTGEAESAPRYKAAFADVPANNWKIFSDPKALRWPERPATR